MAQINNAPVNTQSVAGNSNTSADALISRLQGQSAQLQVTGNNAPVLVLNGRALPLPNNSAIPRNLPPNTPVEISVKEQGSGTIIELQRPGPMAQSLQLTPGQSLQLLQALSNNPGMLNDITPKDVNAKALQIRGDTVVLQVAGKALTFKVPNAAAKFREGQTVSLKLIHGESQWQTAIKSGASSDANSSRANTASVATPNASQVPSLLASGLPKNTPLALTTADKASLINLQRLLPQGLQNAISGQVSPTLTIDKNQQLKLQWTQTTQLIAKLPVDNNLKPKLAELASQLASGNASQPLNAAAGLASSPVNNPLAQQTVQPSLAQPSTTTLSAQIASQLATQITSMLAKANGSLSVQEGLKILAQLPPAPSLKTDAASTKTDVKTEPETAPKPTGAETSKEAKAASNTSASTSASAAQAAQTAEAMSASDIAQLRKLVRDAVLHQTDKASVLNQIQPLLRVLQARTESPSAAVNAIMNALNSLKALDDGPISQYINELGKLITGETGTKATADGVTPPTPQELKQLLTSSPLPVSSQSLSPVSAQGGNQSSMIAGLMGMIQVSLAARLARQQPEQLERLAQLLTPSAAVASGAKSSASNAKTQASKSLSDILSIDGKHQLLKNLDKLASSHQFNRLSNMESQLAGQEGFYYVLPLGDQQQKKDAELLIKRETEKEEQQEQNKSSGNYWALTMKLPIGDIGEMLAKAKISGTNVELDFYTSNQQTKELVFNFMPLLKRRFKQLGIEMDKCQCQLGRIPDALKQRPYSVFEAKA